MNTTVNNKLNPMPIGTLGMWLFLASEAMFFVGLLGAFIVLKSAGGQHEVFMQASQMLSNRIGLASVTLLLLSSCTLQRVPMIATIASLVFLFLQAMQWRTLLLHENGPTQNNYFGFYFLLSTVHVLHVLAGLPVIFWLRPRLPDAIQIYWHFVNVVGVVTLAALYFI